MTVLSGIRGNLGNRGPQPESGKLPDEELRAGDLVVGSWM